MNLTSFLTVASIIGLLSSIAVPNYRAHTLAAQGQASSVNLQMIEAAKREFAERNPGSIPDEQDIAALLPGYRLPVGVHKGETYLYVADLHRLTESSLNGNPAYEPQTSLPKCENGYNDLGQRHCPRRGVILQAGPAPDYPTPGVEYIDLSMPANDPTFSPSRSEG